MHRIARFAFSVSLFLCILLAACAPGMQGTKIELKRYAPDLTSNLSDYRGKHIYLMNFDNQANDTSIWYYFSPDNRVTYGGDSTLHNYFWFAFEKALTSLGMKVSNVDRPDPNAPAIWLTLKSVTDVKYEGEVKLQTYGRPVITKTYTVVEEPLNRDERTPAALEKRAYHMTDKFIETVLTDPEFKSAFLKAAAELAPR
jgi:hypothetical protein